MEITALYNRFLETDGITTDTRNISPNTLFFALKGDNFDANTFAEDALQKGAKYVVLDNPDYYTDNGSMFLVENTLETLQQLARHHRIQLGIPIVALTGSNGKTTTKELFNAVVSQKFNTTATTGNLNNHIGVPLTLLRFNQSTEIGIVEMGANHQKEIEFLCNIALPDLGYITNFGKAHLEGFGGEEGVIIAKSELYNYLKANNKMAIVNLDDPLQKEKTAEIKRFTFSAKNNADVQIQHISANPMVCIQFYNIAVQSNLIGLYNANNINAAIALGKYLNIDNQRIKQAIENYIPTNNRSQLIEKNGNEIILDAYNANPSSMQAALTNFFQLSASDKTAILGDMFELGKESLAEHRKIVEYCTTQPDIQFYFIGKNYKANEINHPNILFFEDFETFSTFFENKKTTKTLLLIKGSRGMSLERTLELL